jgi:hypothetical protein
MARPAVQMAPVPGLMFRRATVANDTEMAIRQSLGLVPSPRISATGVA